MLPWSERELVLCRRSLRWPAHLSPSLAGEFLFTCASPPPVPLLWELAPTCRRGQAGLSQLHPMGHWPWDTLVYPVCHLFSPGKYQLPTLRNTGISASWLLAVQTGRNWLSHCLSYAESSCLWGSQKTVTLQSCIQDVGCGTGEETAATRREACGAGGDGVEMPGGVNSHPSASGTPARPPDGNRE